jgi:hypothetical protein
VKIGKNRNSYDPTAIAEKERKMKEDYNGSERYVEQGLLLAAFAKQSKSGGKIVFSCGAFRR